MTLAELLANMGKALPDLLSLSSRQRKTMSLFVPLEHYQAYSHNPLHHNITLPQMPILYAHFFFFWKNLIGILNAFGGWAAFVFSSENNEKENKV